MGDKRSAQNKNRRYQCEKCGGVFKKVWSDDLANKEAEELWGVKNASENEDMARICDDCFKKFYRWYKNNN